MTPPNQLIPETRTQLPNNPARKTIRKKEKMSRPTMVKRITSQEPRSRNHHTLWSTLRLEITPKWCFFWRKWINKQIDLAWRIPSTIVRTVYPTNKMFHQLWTLANCQWFAWGSRSSERWLVPNSTMWRKIRMETKGTTSGSIHTWCLDREASMESKRELLPTQAHVCVQA